MQKNKQTNAKNKQMNAKKQTNAKHKKNYEKEEVPESMKAAAMPFRSDVPSQYVTSAMCHFCNGVRKRNATDSKAKTQCNNYHMSEIGSFHLKYRSFTTKIHNS